MQASSETQSAAGRFAPSPTGPLHAGSLVTAVASYLSARASGIQWLIRIDDLDGPRNQPGMTQHILNTLNAHNLYPDRAPILQSDRMALYEEALARLQAENQLFYCTCTRKTLPPSGPYPGTCRHRTTPTPETAVRLRVPDVRMTFEDRIQGPQEIDLADVGDFVVKRRDGIISYHLACAVDDGSREVTEVVRGADLLLETAPQLAVMSLLGGTPPTYAHIPILTNASGQKLSKQTAAAAINPRTPSSNLKQALRALGMEAPPAGNDDWTPQRWLAWGEQRFDLARIPRTLPAGFANIAS